MTPDIVLGQAVADITPVVGLIGHMITCGVVLFVLGMMKGFITHGISLAIAEFFLRSKDEEMIKRMCMWFTDGEAILEHLKELKDRTE